MPNYNYFILQDNFFLPALKNLLKSALFLQKLT